MSPTEKTYMSDSSAKIKLVLDVMHQVAQDQDRASRNQNRLKNGSRLRDLMHQQLAEGRIPEGYRYIWILDSTEIIWELLMDIARQFDNQHPDDQASTLDMLDILKRVEARFSKK
jgi:hypothetical protein